MIEIGIVDQWLYLTLSSDAELVDLFANLGLAASDQIISYVAEPGTAMPYIIYNYQSANDVAGVGAVRIFVNGVWQVKVIVEGASFAPAMPIANRVDQVLQRATGAGDGGLVLGCARIQPLQYPEESDGKQYRHLGGLYRVYVQGDE